MKNYILVLILSIISISVYSQKKDSTAKKNPIFFALTFRLLNEEDHIQVFSTHRKLNPNQYVYNTGLGGTIYVPIIYTKKHILMGAEIGEYYFWNNSPAINSSNEVFKRRAEMFPIMLSSSYGLIRTKYFGLSVCINIGGSYNKQVNIFNDNHATVTSNFKPLLLVSIKIRVGSSLSLLHNLSMGLGDLYADKRNFRTAGIALPIVIPR